jgi:hypothetical protein
MAMGGWEQRGLTEKEIGLALGIIFGLLIAGFLFTMFFPEYAEKIKQAFFPNSEPKKK